MQVFQITGPTVNTTAGTTSAALAVAVSSNGPGIGFVRVRNAGAIDVFIEFGNASVVATTTASTPVAAGTIEAFRVPAGVTHVATITAASTALIYFTPGEVG